MKISEAEVDILSPDSNILFLFLFIFYFYYHFYYYFPPHFTLRFEPTICDSGNESDSVICAILSRVHSTRLHFIGFYSYKMDEAKINYSLHDKEMLAIVAAIKERSRYFATAIDRIMV